jgi:microcin C transport system substrate-binding protein
MRLSVVVILLAVLLPLGARAEPAAKADDIQTGNGIALHGAPKYGPDFKHFDYVNPSAPKGGSLWLGIGGTYDNFNPYIIRGNAAPGTDSLLHATLMISSLDEPFSMYAYVADRYSMPKDRSWIEFHINPKARFSDGSPITADDVIFSFNALIKHGRPIYRYYYHDVLRVERTGRLSVRFHLRKGQNRELPLIVAQLNILSKKFWSSRDFEAPLRVPPVSSGPYTVASYDFGRNIIYARNKHWWAQDLPALKGQYNFDRIRYEYYRDASVAIEALKAGDFDFRTENSASTWVSKYNIPAVREGLLIKLKVNTKLDEGISGFIFNTRRYPFKDWRVRRALVYALDVEWQNAKLAFGQYNHSYSFFSNSELAARKGPPKGAVLKILEQYRDQLPKRIFDHPFEVPIYHNGNIRPGLRKAFRLLKEAGFVVRDFRMVNAKTGRPLRFQFLIPGPAYKRSVLPFKRNLKRLGIDMSIRVVDQSQYVQRMQDFDFDMTWNGWGQSLNPGNEQRIYWGSYSANRRGSQNYAGVHSKVVDSLIDKLIGSKDRKDLINYARALDRVLQDMNIIIPLWYAGYQRFVYWDKFSLPKPTALRGTSVFLWWYDAKKAQRLRGRISSLPEPE